MYIGDGGPGFERYCLVGLKRLEKQKRKLLFLVYIFCSKVENKDVLF